MAIASQTLVDSLEWKMKIRDLKENITTQESREMDDVLMYYSIMQNACMQLAGFVAVSSIMLSFFRECKYFVVLCLVLTFLLYIYVSTKRF